MKNIIIATQNLGKLKEMEACLKELPITFKSLSDFTVELPLESGLTFIENALLKARSVSQQTNLPALADDSGLVVRALQGEPGIFSARYSGPHASNQSNINLLLDKMQGIPFSKRSAYFYCAMVLINGENDPTPIIGLGQWEGFILENPEGHQGFGYDPIFYVPSHQCSAAELSVHQKNEISHRGQALKKLKEILQQFKL